MQNFVSGVSRAYFITKMQKQVRSEQLKGIYGLKRIRRKERKTYRLQTLAILVQQSASFYAKPQKQNIVRWSKRFCSDYLKQPSYPQKIHFGNPNDLVTKYCLNQPGQTVMGNSVVLCRQIFVMYKFVMCKFYCTFKFLYNFHGISWHENLKFYYSHVGYSHVRHNQSLLYIYVPVPTVQGLKMQMMTRNLFPSKILQKKLLS
eukprot:TRINITY_DN9717_c0_g1_i2.p2 TRINITY_DN9717_c0_g1~~TRINITY_DN9717_c0_g1_i2.p2  ORF type:complete len:203 (-),score=-13.84 TRINITY_DN9717_c0_g1_i2:1753-2361(-)